jgi:glycogen operon protein
MIAFRKAHPTIARSRFWREDVLWFGTKQDVDMSSESRHLAFHLSGASQDDADLYVMINMHEQDRPFEIQVWPTAGSSAGWRLVCDTSQESPRDFYGPGQEVPIERREYPVKARSVAVLMRPR